jgi:hypothetical protein
MVDAELDAFKRHINLVNYATSRFGYQRDRRESSKASHVLRHPTTDDKIVVRQNQDGHWTYFSVRDDRDNGSIVDFVKHRTGSASLGHVRQELRQWVGTARPDPEPSFSSSARPAAPADPTQQPAKAFAAARASDNSPYLNARGIRPDTLRDPRFADAWRIDARRNVLFPHRDDAGTVTGCEIKNRGFTGFSAGGVKTAWRSHAVPEDTRVLVIAESAIDALSYHQLQRDHADRTAYLSTAGALSSRQLELVDLTCKRLPKGGAVIAAVDADAGGDRIAAQLQGLTAKHPHLTFQRHSPERALGKDWNEALQHCEQAYIRSLPLAVRSLTQSRDRSR